MGVPSLSLILLRTSRMQELLSLYGALGFAFNEEKHGSGPVHHSSGFGSTLIEIYPGEDSQRCHWKAVGTAMLGFSVESLDANLRTLEKLGAQYISAPKKDSPWGRRAIVADPDGRAVELSEPNKN